MQHLNPFFARRAAVSTTLAVSDCVDRLRADLAPWYVFWGVPQGMKGRAGEGGFAVRRFTGARKSLPSQARGHFEPDGRGTRLEFVIGWQRADLVGLTLAMAGLITALALAGAQDATIAWAPWVVVPVVAVVCVLHRLATLHDDDWLVARLCEKLQGTEVPVALS